MFPAALGHCFSPSMRRSLSLGSGLRASVVVLSRQARAGRAAQLAPGIYAVGASLRPEAVCRHHLFAIVAHVWPAAVICDRSALAGGQPVDGYLFICHPEPPRATELRLPGTTVVTRVGPAPLPGDMPMPNGLFVSGPVRQLVENIPARGRPGNPPRLAGLGAVEDTIEEQALSGGAGNITQLLQGLEVLRGSFSESVERCGSGSPRSSAPRWTTCPCPGDARHDSKASPTTSSGWTLSAVWSRPCGAPPRHHVQPSATRSVGSGSRSQGTLRHGFDLLNGLTDPFQRALAVMLLLTEVHPFDDGNGRIARILANAELARAGQVRIVIPTSYRNDYLAGLNGVSNRAGQRQTLIAVLDLLSVGLPRWTGRPTGSTRTTELHQRLRRPRHRRTKWPAPSDAGALGVDRASAVDLGGAVGLTDLQLGLLEAIRSSQ